MAVTASSDVGEDEEGGGVGSGVGSQGTESGTKVSVASGRETAMEDMLASSATGTAR